MTDQIEGDKMEMVAFRTAGQEFCIDIMSVREIRGWVAATTLPHSPNYVRGVINLRGSVVPIIDLSARLGMGHVEHDDRNVIIIVKIAGQTIGLLVESVSDILGVQSSAIQPVPDVFEPGTLEFVKGVVMGDRGSIRVIDIRNVLGSERAERPQ